MGSSHLQEDSWMDEEFSKLATKIEEMGKEMENLKDHYGVEDRFNEVIKECADTKGLVERNGFGNKNKSDQNELESKNGFSKQSDGLNDINTEQNILEKGLNGNFNPNEVFESDSDNSLNITNEAPDGNAVRKERLVLKLKRLSRKYFMVDKLPIKDKNIQKQFVNYEAERYAFQVYVDDLPKVYRCKLCPKIYHKITSLVFHKRTHTKLPPGYNAGDFARRFSNHAAPIEPYMPAIHNKLTEYLVPHPRDYPGYLTLEKSLPVLRTGSTVIFNGDTFFVGDFIGEGGFAKVYGAIWENGPLEERDTVLKIQAPANDWEWYILNQVHTRYDAMDHPLKEKIDWKGGFMNTPRCYNFYQGAIIISKHQKMGTLLDLVNLTKNADKSIIEPIAIYLMAELLGLMDLLHTAEIVHADIKPDNFLLRHTPGTLATPSLQLIDFGKAIDLNLASDNKENVDQVKKSNADDGMELDEDEEDLTEEEKEDREIEKNEKEVEEKQNALFTDVGRAGQYHLDYYGIAGCAYCLLFGKYLEVGLVKNRWVVKGNFQRRWHTKLWLQFFDDMLNPKREMDKLPSLQKWRQRLMDLFNSDELREGMEKAREVIDAKLLEKIRRTL